MLKRSYINFSPPGFLLAGQAELAEGAGAHAALGGESLLNIGHEVRDVAPETLDRFKYLKKYFLKKYS